MSELNTSDPGPPREPIHRLTVEQYRQMAEAGILTPNDRVELLEGLLVERMTKRPPHRIATRRTRVALEAVVPAGWYVDTQEPITTSDSEPEPDVAVIRGATEDYADQNPGAAQVGLVVEIADATLRRDRETKARVYARAGVPFYWIVDLVSRSLEILSNPTGPAPEPRYQARASLGAEDETPVILAGVEVGRVRVSQLLP